MVITEFMKLFIHALRHLRSFKFAVVSLSTLLAFISIQATFAHQSEHHSHALNLSELKHSGERTLTGVTSYLVDSDHTASMQEVLAKKTSMKHIDSEVINFGFVDPSYWFTSTIHNDQLEDQSFLFEVGYSLLDQVDLYVIDDSNDAVISEFHTGDSLPFSAREMDQPTFVFPMTLEQGKSIRVLLKVRTSSAMQVPLTVWDPVVYNSTTQAKSLFFGCVMGIIGIMALYNLFLFLSIKDKSYLFFSACSIGYVISEASLTGIGYQIFWPTSTYWNQISLPFSANMALAALVLFSRDFLSIKTSIPGAYKLFGYTALLGGINTLLSLFLPYQLMILSTLGYVLLAPLVGYCAGIYLWRSGFKPARYYTGAFTTFMLAITILVFAKLSILPTSFFTENAIHFGAIAVVSLLSFALADRINRERNDKEHAQHTAISNLEKYREVYERALEGMFQLDQSGNLLDCNPAFASLIGAKSVSELKKSPINLLALVPSINESPDVLMGKLRTKGYVFGFEAECNRIDGSEFWASIHARMAGTKDQEDIIEGSIVDITDKKVNEQKLEYLATHDSLTGLINRSEFENRLKETLSHFRTGHTGHCMLFLDLDQFKIVNDTSGHRAGDELLKCLSEVLKDNARTRDSIARLGGDEFAILLERCPLEKAEEVANNLRRRISEYKFNWEGKTFSVGASIGIVPINQDHPSIEEIFSLADTACYGAKDAGRNCIMVHSPKSNEVMERQSEMRQVAILKEAIKLNQLVLYKQYISPAASNEVIGGRYEILVRMIKGDELIPPGAFLPAAERYNAIVEMDKWVVENYFKWLSNNPEEQQKLVQVNINLSGQTLGDSEFPDFLDQMFEIYEVPTEKVCLEITESTAVRSLSKTNTFISRLKLRGIKFALDDFGSGFSSYSYLKNLKVDTLKIDGSFITNIVNDPVDRSMVESIANVAQVIGIKTVAEFVEDQTTLDLLNEIGVDYNQGYYIHEPCPLESPDDKKLSNGPL
jgi:diguanylate cyclase (GGDEF)-like protein/PAS domain S-box-containing protein